MEAVRDFLNWFDGFSDNIEEAPSKGQWDKVTSRIAKLREEHAMAPAQQTTVYQAVAPAPAMVPGPANGAASKEQTLLELSLTDRKKAEMLWRSRYTAHIIKTDPTVDGQTAKEFGEQVFSPDFTISPEQAAEAEMKTWKV